MTIPKEKVKQIMEKIQDIKITERFIENEIISKQMLLGENRKRRAILQESLEMKMDETP